ncbi:MAG: N-formylglutamate amidohydrolase, partial [Gammaproteobacteria bacterium]|nr:N-formylglutamate amidohydrolase [Gammaproteobacteria bacterium]
MRPWVVRPGNLPVIALAIHCGHSMRPEVEKLSALSEAQREREEDPHTQLFLPDDATQVIVHCSRFEVDLNRVREKAVYRTPDDAWGLKIWKAPPTQSLVQGSLAIYDWFYRELNQLIQEQIDRHGRVLLLDMHSYNYRRHGRHAPAQPPAENPEINLGTTPLGKRWESVVTRFIDDLSSFE